ncbi:MAG: putative molybdenum carrier protein [Proteobacteria bacterium]|nr:putative molybdenum carrier protein [Pseudomonadota bacterium]
MKSIPQMAEDLDISTSTIREYLKSFKEFFADPVEHEGVKEYPPETSELISKIYTYYQSSGLTKEEIRIKLGGEAALDSEPAVSASQPVAVSAAPMAMAQFEMLGEKIDKLTMAIEILTATLSGSGVKMGIGGFDKIDEFNAQITEILEISKESDDKNIEKNVQDADGTLVFSFGKLTTNAEKALKFGQAYKKPYLHVDLEVDKNPVQTVKNWLSQSRIKILHVAGRNASKVPLLKKTVNDIIASILDR